MGLSDGEIAAVVLCVVVVVLIVVGVVLVLAVKKCRRQQRLKRGLRTTGATVCRTQVRKKDATIQAVHVKRLTRQIPASPAGDPSSLTVDDQFNPPGPGIVPDPPPPPELPA